MPANENPVLESDGKINRLRHTRGYLCGAMDRTVDGGVEWRVNIQEDLRDLDVYWLDPTRKPIDIGIEDLENREYRHRMMQAHNYDAVRSDMKIIRGVDLRMVDVSDFIIVNLDLEIHATGTYEELYLANRQKKPVIIRIVQGKENTPDWLLGTLPHEMFFSTWKEVHNYLRHIDRDPVIQHFNRWYFFDYSMCSIYGGGNVTER